MVVEGRLKGSGLLLVVVSAVAVVDLVLWCSPGGVRAVAEKRLHIVDIMFWHGMAWQTSEGQTAKRSSEGI